MELAGTRSPGVYVLRTLPYASESVGRVIFIRLRYLCICSFVRCASFFLFLFFASFLCLESVYFGLIAHLRLFFSLPLIDPFCGD